MKKIKIKYLLLALSIILIILGTVIVLKIKNDKKTETLTRKDAIDLINEQFNIEKENLEWASTSKRYHAFYYKISSEETYRYEVDIKTGKITESQYLGTLDFNKE